MNTELRILSRIFEETSKAIKRSRWMNIVIITTMAAILSIFACLFRSSLFVSHFVQEVGNSLEVSVYLKEGKAPKEVAKKFVKYKNVRNLKIITKEEAWKDLKKQMEITNLENPLPNTIRVQLKDKTNIKEFINVVKKMDFTEDVYYADELADKVASVGSKINVAAIVIVLTLILLTFSIINNTLHLVIESRKKEIEIMRMMGVSDWYIRAPYIFQGVFYGFSGAAVSLIPLFFINTYTVNLAKIFYLPIDIVNTKIVVISVILMGMIVGGIGSTFAVKRYLRI